MHPQWSVSFREDVSVTENGGREVVLEGPFSRLVLRKLPAKMLSAIKDVASPGMPIDELTGRVRESGVPNPFARMIHYLQTFARHGMLTVSSQSQGRPVATLEPIGAYFDLPCETQIPARFLLSRFVLLRRRGNEFLLETPLSASRVILHDARAAAVLFALNKPHTLLDVVDAATGLAPDDAESLIRLLHGAGMLSPAEDRSAEDNGRTSAGESTSAASGSQPAGPPAIEPAELQTWEFHDLLFHARSRMGRHDDAVGATFPFVGVLDPPPPLKQMPGKDSVQLPIPDLSEICRNDMPFAETVERRRSIRDFGDPPIAAAQLGEFLYRTMRVRDLYEFDVETPNGTLTMDFISRPYPSGGALYELELYPVVQRCDGLEAGMYHYDGLDHRLVRLCGLTPDVKFLISDAGLSSGVDEESIQVLVVVAARFARMSWKYTSMSYAAILKHVGVLYQSMYLTATAMNLAPCALGAGNSDTFTKAVGGDYYAETSVGEFLLGSRGIDGIEDGGLA